MKKQLFSVVLLSFFFLFQNAFAQQNTLDACLYGNILSEMESQYPGYREVVQRTFDEAKETHSAFRGVYTIPVVVHIVWKNAVENLPDSIIHQQIEQLNKCYRRQNSDAKNLRQVFKNVAADAMIEFKLAQIVRVQTSKTFQFNLNSLASLDAVKETAKGGSNAWDPEHYLNIWVCNIKPLIILGTENPLLGYSYPPANLKNWPAGSNAPSLKLDGVVIHYPAFGINKKFTIKGFGDIAIEGKTCVHEVGHYLGLRHIWGDGQQSPLGGVDCTAEDGVDDTPHSGTQSQFDCDTTKNTCTNDKPIDLPDMIENYMDYSSETCTNTFTQGQVGIMHGVLEGARKKLLESSVATTDLNEKSPSLLIAPNPTTGIINLKIKGVNERKATLEVTDVLGCLIHKQMVDSDWIDVNLSNQAAGIYFVTLRVNGFQTVKKIVKE
jgi:Pregnancy-associated plasma protein-A/Secretion system C-terminal sorting domain